MTFMILLKPYVWQKFGSQVKCKNALGQSDCRIFKHNISKAIEDIHLIFLYAGTHLLKLQTDDVILGGCSQACPAMPKEAIKT